MENTIEIRPLNINERAQALNVMRMAINERCTRYYGERTVMLWTSKENKHFDFQLPQHCFGAINGVGPVAISGWSPQDGADDVARISAMFTSDAYSRKGIGRQLMAEVEQEIADAGYSKIILFATLNALPFYRSLGYSEQGDRMLEVADGHFISVRRMQKII